MGKNRQKGTTEVEILRGEVRRLKKKIKQLERREHFFDNAVEEAVEDLEIKDSCNNCGKGTIIVMDLGRIQIHKCDICDFKEVKK